MKLIKLTENEFREYSNHHPLKTFVQTVEMGKIRANKGWNVDYLGLKDNDEILGATMLVSHPRFLGKKEFYAPRGFLLDYNNEQLVTVFINEITKFVKKNNGFKLRIDPYLELKERDINGNIVDNGIDNSRVVSLLKSLGFTKSYSDEQLKWLYVLNLEGKTEAEILKGMSSTNRNIIRKTLKTNIKLRELRHDELELFEKITKETGERRGFASKNLDYYRQMDDLFKDDVKYVVAELNLKNYVETLTKELEKETNRLDKLSDVKANDGKRKEIKVTINSLKKKIDKANDLIESDGVNIILSGAMFMTYGDEVVYLFCGNYKKYMEFGAQYFIQWQMIKYALENNYKVYNFYGISGNFDKNDPSYGIYEFKKGFGGRVVELLGDYELGIGFTYKLYRLMKGIRK